MNKLYRGIRQGQVAKVFVDNAELSFGEAKKLRPSEATPEWGYFGEGPTQTALAVLYDAIQTFPNANNIALKYYHDFKYEFIANANYEIGFLILESQIHDWINKRLINEQNPGPGWVV